MSYISKLKKLGENASVILETRCAEFFDFADTTKYSDHYIFLTKSHFIVLKEKGFFNETQILKKYSLSDIRTDANGVPEFFTIKKKVNLEGDDYENGFLGFTIQFQSTMKGLYFKYTYKEEKKEIEAVINLWTNKIKEIYKTNYKLSAMQNNVLLTRYCINCGTQLQGYKGDSTNCPNCNTTNNF